MTEDPKPSDFDTSDLPRRDEFDSKDLETTPITPRAVDRELEQIQIKEMGNAIGKLEARVRRLEEVNDHLETEVRQLRKHVSVLIKGH